MLLRGSPPATLAVPVGPFSQLRGSGLDAGFHAVSPLGPALDPVGRAVAA
ncbi:hypothetical protein BSU04_06980 [Caballeronia sordidicola]|uniref:Uncharacterized protein n=1 Tax=Caballeronia sordidicola TaxID=196367 RepID=A0A226X994_CABSO|nr:hypothetical protein BSU04_06980 [Caballeronia sordidicola]